MNTQQIKELLNDLQIKGEGKVTDQGYELILENSNTYAKMYTLLDNNAINREFPTTESNTVNTPTKFINYFEKEFKNKLYEITLTADFEAERYAVLISPSGDF